jgi:hypothetical protein
MSDVKTADLCDKTLLKNKADKRMPTFSAFVDNIFGSNILGPAKSQKCNFCYSRTSSVMHHRAQFKNFKFIVIPAPNTRQHTNKHRRQRAPTDERFSFPKDVGAERSWQVDRKSVTPWADDPTNKT